MAGRDQEWQPACIVAGVMYIGNHMVTISSDTDRQTSDQLDLTFGALADPTRRSILEQLAIGPSTVGDLAAPFEMSRPAISKHLRVLEKAGLVARTRDGRVSRCRLDARPMVVAAEWVEHYRVFWEQQLDSLSKYFESQEDQQIPPSTT